MEPPVGRFHLRTERMNAQPVEDGWQCAVARRLRALALRYPSRPAAVGTDHVITFGELFSEAARVAEAESKDGDRDGVTVLHASSSVSFLVRVCAALLAGRTPLVLPERIDAAEAVRAAEEVRQARRAGCRPWKAVLTVLGGRQVPVVTHGESPTAPRKAYALGMRHGGCALIAAPLYLNGPFEFCLRQLLLGGTVILLSRFTTAGWLHALMKHRPDWGFLVPGQLQQVWDAVGDTAASQACVSLRHLVYSSAPCPPELRARLITALGPSLSEYYGTTLYDGTITSYDAHAGTPLPGADLRVVDPQGRPCPAGVEGRVEGRSSCGLINHPAADPCLGDSSWRGVGDRGLLLPHAGRLRITEVDTPGRVIVAGVKVAPDVTRRVLLAHPAVDVCTVTVRPHPRLGSVLSAAVTTNRPDVTRATLRSWCAEQLPPPQRPLVWEVRTSPDPTREGHVHL